MTTSKSLRQPATSIINLIRSFLLLLCSKTMIMEVSGKTLNGTWRLSQDLVELEWLQNGTGGGTWGRVEHEYYCKNLWGTKNPYDKYEFDKYTMAGEYDREMKLNDLLCDYHRDNSRGTITVQDVSAQYSYIELKGDNFKMTVTFDNYLTLTDASKDDYYYIKLRVDHQDDDYTITLKDGHDNEYNLEDVMDSSEYFVEFKWT